MITFFKDYFELINHSKQWMRKHWRGYIILVIVLAILYYGIWYMAYSRENIVRMVKNLFRKDYEEEEA